MRGDSGTWHYGLIARWWAEFNRPEPEEVAYYEAAIRHWGEPALDLGCGTGRILVPLLEAGLDVDGVDISADMVALAAQAAAMAGYGPRLFVMGTHELELPRTYRTIFLCGVFGIGGWRDRDLEGLRRAHGLLESGGALLINHELPYERIDEERWARWLAGHRTDIPRPWPETGDRRRAANGDEIELISRLLELDPFEQRHVLEMRARLWRAGSIVAEEAYKLAESLYFAQEIRPMLTGVGFREVVLERGYSGQPATADDGIVTYVATK